MGTRIKKTAYGLSVPERHQLKIARQTLSLSEVGASILGGPSHAEAREIIKRLTGRFRGDEIERAKR